MVRKIICLSSGGLDSFAMLHLFKKLNYEVIGLYVDYGHLSRKKEYKSVKLIANRLNIDKILKTTVKNYSKLFSNNLTIKNKIINDYFPGRNFLLLTIAASVASELGFQEIGIGVINSERVFTDCTSLFFSKLEEIFNITFNSYIGIQTPLEYCSKVDIIRYLIKNSLPLNITYSCQKGKKKHCKRCPSCIERFKAIQLQ